MRRVVGTLLSIAGVASQSSFPFPPCKDCVDGVVMGGADVTAYFSLTAGAPGIMGSKDHAIDHQNYTFYFANGENAATFKSNPDKYIPAWGGF